MTRAAGVICCWAAAISIAAAQQPVKPAQKPPAKPPAPAKPAPAKPAAPTPPPPPPPDLVVKTEYVAGDKKTSSTISGKGSRQRIDYGSEMTVIAQCDAGRLIQIDDQGKRFLISSFDPPAADAAGKPPKKGGTLTYTTTVTDTGEKKPMFGLQARHLKVVIAKDASADSCDKRREHVETDGWFVDAPAALACSVADRKLGYAVTSGCRDEVKYVAIGASASAGYPLAYTTTATNDDKPSTMTMTVTAFDRQTLAESLFSVPEGYREVKTLADLTAPPRQPGSRVGVTPVTTKLKETLSLQALSEALVVSLNDANVDAVALEASSPASAITEARAKSVDYILISDVTDIRKPQRGIVGRVSGARDFGAKVDFLLMAPSAATPLLSSSERSGASTLQTAVTTARNVSKFMTPMGLLSSRFDFMKTLTALGGGNPSMGMQQSQDPTMNTINFILDSVGGTNPDQQPHELMDTADAAVASALEKEVAAIAAKIVKK